MASIRTELKIEAPVKDVWHVLSDLPRWSDWNLRAETLLEHGEDFGGPVGWLLKTLIVRDAPYHSMNQAVADRVSFLAQRGEGAPEL